MNAATYSLFDYTDDTQRNGGLIDSVMTKEKKEERVVVAMFPVQSDEVHLNVDVSSLDKLPKDVYASLNEYIILALIEAFVNTHIKNVIFNLRQRVEQESQTSRIMLTPREAFATAAASGVEITLVLESSNIKKGQLAFRTADDSIKCYLDGKDVVVVLADENASYIGRDVKA